VEARVQQREVAGLGREHSWAYSSQNQRALAVLELARRNEPRETGTDHRGVGVDTCGHATGLREDLLRDPLR
jgi:hypothetical protein